MKDTFTVTLAGAEAIAGYEPIWDDRPSWDEISADELGEPLPSLPPDIAALFADKAVDSIEGEF